MVEGVFMVECLQIRRARLQRLGQWSTGEPLRASPTAEASTDRSAYAGGKLGGRMTRKPADTESTVAAEGRRGRMLENA